MDNNLHGTYTHSVIASTTPSFTWLHLCTKMHSKQRLMKCASHIINNTVVYRFDASALSYAKKYHNNV